MVEPDTEVYAAQYLDDGLGEGFRVYTSRDDVYEARQVDDTEIRIYPDDDGWWMKTRYPVNGDTEAYDLMQDVFDTVEVEAGTRPSLTHAAFHDGVEQGRISREEAGFTVEYRTEHGYNLNVPTSRIATVGGSTAALGAFIGGGAGIGGTIGAAVLGGAGLAVGGPPAAAAAATVGAQGGGAIGGLVGTVVSFVDIPDAFKDRPVEPCPTRNIIDRFDDRMRRRRERKILGKRMDESLLEQVNEKRALDVYMAEEGNYDPEKAERQADLEDAGLEEALDELWTIQFDQFEQGEGVSVTKQYDTYQEAVEAVPAFVDDTEPVDRPSIYHDAETLAVILDALPAEDEDVVVRNALDGEPSDDVEQLLDEEYGDVVADVGPEWTLENR